MAHVDDVQASIARLRSKFALASGALLADAAKLQVGADHIAPNHDAPAPTPTSVPTAPSAAPQPNEAPVPSAQRPATQARHSGPVSQAPGGVEAPTSHLASAGQTPLPSLAGVSSLAHSMQQARHAPPPPPRPPAANAPPSAKSQTLEAPAPPTPANTEIETEEERVRRLRLERYRRFKMRREKQAREGGKDSKQLLTSAGSAPPPSAPGQPKTAAPAPPIVSAALPVGSSAIPAPIAAATGSEEGVASANGPSAAASVAKLAPHVSAPSARDAQTAAASTASSSVGVAVAVPVHVHAPVPAPVPAPVSAPANSTRLVDTANVPQPNALVEGKGMAGVAESTTGKKNGGAGTGGGGGGCGGGDAPSTGAQPVVAAQKPRATYSSLFAARKAPPHATKAKVAHTHKRQRKSSAASHAEPTPQPPLSRGQAQVAHQDTVTSHGPPQTTNGAPEGVVPASASVDGTATTATGDHRPATAAPVSAAPVAAGATAGDGDAALAGSAETTPSVAQPTESLAEMTFRKCREMVSRFNQHQARHMMKPLPVTMSALMADLPFFRKISCVTRRAMLWVSGFLVLAAVSFLCYAVLGCAVHVLPYLAIASRGGPLSTPAAGSYAIMKEAGAPRQELKRVVKLGGRDLRHAVEACVARSHREAEAAAAAAAAAASTVLPSRLLHVKHRGTASSRHGAAQSHSSAWAEDTAWIVPFLDANERLMKNGEEEGQKVRVAVRLRPLIAQEVAAGETPVVTIVGKEVVLDVGKGERMQFKFDHTFDSSLDCPTPATQETVFEVCASHSATRP